MIDDQIRDALNVDPSPEFLARVRTRVANEPEPSVWRWSWTIATGAALAAAVFIAIVVSRPPQNAATAGRPGPAEPGALASEAAVAAGPRRPAPRELAPASSSRPAQVFARRVESGLSRTVPPASAEPEILLDPAETRTLRNLIAGVRDGRVDLSVVQHSTTPVPMDLAPVADIVIAPITIEPIAPPVGAEGVRP